MKSGDLGYTEDFTKRVNARIEKSLAQEILGLTGNEALSPSQQADADEIEDLAKLTVEQKNLFKELVNKLGAAHKQAMEIEKWNQANGVQELLGSDASSLEQSVKKMLKEIGDIV